MSQLVERAKNSLDSIREIVIIYAIATSVAALLFTLFEGKDLLTSYWWVFVTGLTIGYGDIYPVTVAGKVLTIVWAHFMVFVFAPVAVGYVVVNMIKNRDEWTDEEQREMMEILRELRGRK